MKLVLRGVPGLDGQPYEADFTRFTNNEGKLIKKLSGVRMGEIQEALRAGDNELLVACAVVFLARAGIDPVMAETMLGEAEVGCVDFDTTDEEIEANKKAEADARPPDSPTRSGSESEPESSESESGPTGSSGDSTTNGLAPPPGLASLPGVQILDTGATSDRQTLAT